MFHFPQLTGGSHSCSSPATLQWCDHLQETPFTTPDTSFDSGDAGLAYTFRQLNLPTDMTPFIMVKSQDQNQDQEQDTDSLSSQNGDPLDQSATLLDESYQDYSVLEQKDCTMVVQQDQHCTVVVQQDQDRNHDGAGQNQGEDPDPAVTSGTGEHFTTQ